MFKFIKKAKSKVIAFASAMALTAVTAVSASAAEPEGLGAYSEQITQQFENTAADVMPIIIGVLGVGLGIFGIFKGIKLAKKMFGTVSNG